MRTCFGLLVPSLLGFKARVVRLIVLGRGIYVTCSPRFISTATSADVLVASKAAKSFSATYVRTLGYIYTLVKAHARASYGVFTLSVSRTGPGQTPGQGPGRVGISCNGNTFRT